MSSFEDVITPPKRFASVDWGELWRYRDLFLVLAWRDIAVRYKQTALGVLWAIFQPLITMLIFTFIFSRLAKIGTGDTTPYPIFVYVGQLFWLYFSNTLTNASNSLVSNAQLVQKIYFPRLILPATAATTGLVDLALAALVLAGLMFHFGFAPHLVGILVLPLLLVTVVMAAMGVGLYFASLNVKYRDVRHALPFIVQTLMYVTPVVYPISMLDTYPKVKALMLWLNPVSGVITNARASIIGNAPVDWYVLGVSLLSSLVYFVLGLCYFRSTERYFADIV